MVTYQAVSISELRRSILDEIVKAVGLPRSKFWRNVFTPLFWLPADRFSRFGAFFDEAVAKFGFHQAVNRALSFLVDKVEVSGIENIPKSGPLLVVSNHPGTYDGLAITAQIPRDDVKIVASQIPFIQNLKIASRHFIFSTLDTYVRMLVIKNAVEHLKNRGALLIFPSGHIDPEPAFMPHALAELNTWSRSVEIFVRKVPDVTIQVVIVSNVLLQRYMQKPLTRLRSKRINRQRIAEFLQIISQMVLRKKFNNIPRITFAEPFQIDKKGKNNNPHMALERAIALAKNLMRHHINNY